MHIFLRKSTSIRNRRDFSASHIGVQLFEGKIAVFVTIRADGNVLSLLPVMKISSIFNNVSPKATPCIWFTNFIRPIIYYERILDLWGNLQFIEGLVMDVKRHMDANKLIHGSKENAYNRNIGVTAVVYFIPSVGRPNHRTQEQHPSTPARASL